MYNTALQDVLQSLDNIFFSLRSIQGIREIFPTKAQVSRGFSITTITFNRGYASAFISIISLQEENILTIGLFFLSFRSCVFICACTDDTRGRHLAVWMADRNQRAALVVRYNLYRCLFNSHSALSHRLSLYT